MIIIQTILHGHIFCGIGGGAEGIDQGEARVGNLVGRFKCAGGIDVDAAACRDFSRRIGVPAICRDLFTREQYAAFHGREPPRDFVEAVPDDIRRAFGNRRPHIIFLSAPCKGFSGLLSETVSRSAKYQALNGLTLRGVWLALEAFENDPVELYIFENVPRIATRGRPLLDKIDALFHAYGYVTSESNHDCGELGNLGQSRKRFLKVARYPAKVPNFLYEPIRRPLRGVGEIIGALPVPFPGVEAWNPMHRMPALNWKTWVRLAFVETGADWRSLNKLAVEGGMLRDYAIAPDVGWHGGVLGVHEWGQHTGVVTSRGSPTTGAHAVADPRLAEGAHDYQNFRVRHWEQTAGALTTKSAPGSSAQSVADPRIAGKPRFNSAFRIVRWPETSPAVAGPGGPAGGLGVADPRYVNWHPGASSAKLRVSEWDDSSYTVTGSQQVGSGALSVADPRPGYGPSTHHHVLKVTDWDAHGGTVTASHHPAGGALCVADPRAGAGFNGKGKCRVTGFHEPAGSVIGASTTGQGAFAVADPRPDCLQLDRAAYLSGGHYGVVPWHLPSGAVPGFAKNNNGRWSVADPRTMAGDDGVGAGLKPAPTDGEACALPVADARLVAIIQALDGTWHRPFTTLELAALQGLVDPQEQFELDGLSDSAWRERIGNCVPPPSAKAIAGVMGRALLLAWSGETSAMSCEPVWVRPVAAALMAAQGAPLKEDDHMDAIWEDRADLDEIFERYGFGS